MYAKITLYIKGDLVIIAPEVIHSNASQEGFTNILITIDNIPINIENSLIISDTSNKVFCQVFSQIHHFYNSCIEQKDIILQNLGELITNLIIAYANLERNSPVIERLRNGIVTHFSEYFFDINDLFEAEESYNSNYLKKLLKKEVGISPQQYVINLRINYAKKLLMNTTSKDFSISHIAYACGYEDPLYFSRVFKKQTGLSPKSFYEDYCKKKSYFYK